MLPTTPEMPGAAAGKRVLEALRSDQRPKLHLWADSDPIIPFKVGERFAAAINAEPAREDRERLALPPGGRRRADRPPDRRVAREIEMSGALYRLGQASVSRRRAEPRLSGALRP